MEENKRASAKDSSEISKGILSGHLPSQMGNQISFSGEGVLEYFYSQRLLVILSPYISSFSWNRCYNSRLAAEEEK
jgi:hypothetical protein